MKKIFIKKLPKDTRFYKKSLSFDVYYNSKYIYIVYTKNEEKIIKSIKLNEEEKKAILLKIVEILLYSNERTWL